MIKRIVTLLLALTLCACSVGSALAQLVPLEEPRCDAREVDLSDVREENGRLLGVLHLPEGPYPQGEVRIDCPMPAGFTPAQARLLNIAYKPIDKKALEAAMKAVGQSTKAGELHQWSDANEFQVSYSLWQMNREPGGFSNHELMDASYYDDPDCADTYAQAKSIVQSVLEQLGAKTFEPLMYLNRYDEAHCVSADSFSCYSNGEAMYQRALENFRKNAAKYKHIEPGLTMVNGMYELFGLPVMYKYSWMDGSDRMGASSEFFSAVSDDGELRWFQLNSLPTVQSTEPLELPSHTWQDIVARVAAGWWLGNPHDEYVEVVSDYNEEAYICYATYSVITAIKPCWIGYEKGSLVLGYYMTAEERTVDGDRLIFVWSSYGDAETLTLVH